MNEEKTNIINTQIINRASGSSSFRNGGDFGVDEFLDLEDVGGGEDGVASFFLLFLLGGGGFGGEVGTKEGV